MRQIWVDFNSVDDDGCVVTLARFAEPDVALSAGSTIVVGDDDGNACDGVIVGNARQGAVTVRLKFDTFRQLAVAHRVAV